MHFKKAAEGAGRQISHVGHVFQPDGCGIVLQNVTEYLIKPAVIVGAPGLLEGFNGQYLALRISCQAIQNGLQRD